MSNVIENQVVQMEFDNQNFEKNVHISINSIKELRDSLQMGSETSSSLMSALNSLSNLNLTKSLDAISDRFSTFGIVGMTAIQRITNAAIDLGLTLEQKVLGTATAAWNQIITGGTSRASNIEQATFQLKGLFGETAAGEVKLQMAMTGTSEQIRTLTGLTEDLIVADNAANYAVADTAYGLDSAAKAASQLAASGVDVLRYQEELADSTGHMRTEMQVALRAISGTAAMTNSSYDDMARTFARVAGNGRVMALDLNSLGSRGLNAAATLAQYLRETGKDANATEASIREMVSRGQIDFMTFAKAMDSAYGEHAKDANSTFNGAFDNMRFALSKIGADFIAPLRDDMIPVLNNVRMAFNAVRASLTPFLTAFKSISHYVTDSIVDKFGQLIGAGATDAEWKGSDQWNKAIENLTNVVQIATDILREFVNYVGSVIKPISAAWKEMFPSKGYEGFISILNRIKDFIHGMVLSESAMSKLQRTAKGIFSIAKIAKQIIDPIIGGIKELLRYFGILDADILDKTANIGDALYELSESGKIGKGVQELVDKIVNLIEGIKTVSKDAEEINNGSFKETIKGVAGSIGDFFKNLSESGSMSKGAQAVIDVLSSIASAIGNLFSMLAGNFANNAEAVGENVLTISEVAILIIGLMKLFDVFKGVNALDPKFFTQIVISLAAIVLSIVTLASIDHTALENAVITLAIVFGLLTVSLAVISNGFSTFKNTFLNASAQVKGFRGLLTAGFFAKINTVFDAMAEGFREIGMGLLVGSVGLSVYLLTKGITDMANAFLEIVDKCGTIETAASVMGGAMAAVIILLAGVSKIYNEMVSHTENIDAKSQIKVAVAITALSNFARVMAKAVGDFGKMSLNELAKGLLSVGSLMVALWGLYAILDKYDIKNPEGSTKLFLAIGVSVSAIMLTVSQMAKVVATNENGMASLGASAAVLGGIILAIAGLIFVLNKLPVDNSALKTVGSMVLIIGSISALGIVLTKLAGISWNDLEEPLIAIGAIMAMIAGLAVVSKFTGNGIGMLAVAAAIASIGVAAAGIGAGLYLGAKALETLVDAIIKLGQAWKENGPEILEGMQATLTQIAQIIPYFITQAITGFIDGFKSNMDKITALAPYLSSFIGTVLVGIIQTLASNIGPLVDALVNLIVNIINALSNRMPDILGAVENFIVNFLSGVVGLVSGIIGVVAEGIGEIFGSLVGGLLKGLENALKNVSFVNFATELSNFMFALQPFIDGCNGLNKDSMEAAATLAGVITVLTADAVIAGLTSWFAGDNNIEDFGKQLAAFGPYIKSYADSVKGLDVAAVEASVCAATMCADFARIIPNEGGLLSAIVGDNDIETFGSKLAKFGPYLKSYADSVKGLDVASVTASACAALMLAQFADTIPNEGGMLAKITGDNDIETFGKELKSFGKHIADYADEVKDIDRDSVDASICAAMMLSEFANTIPNSGGFVSIFTGDNSVNKFGEQLVAFGQSIKDYYSYIKDIDSASVKEITSSLIDLFDILGMSDRITMSSVDNLHDILEGVAEMGLAGFLEKIADDSSDDIKDAINKFGRNVKEGFKQESESIASNAKDRGFDIVKGYADGIRSKEAKDEIKSATQEVADYSIKALGDRIGDPLEEPATGFLPVGHSAILGYGGGMTEELPDLLQTIHGIGDDSIGAMDNSSAMYNQGQTDILAYIKGMQSVNTSNLPANLPSSLDAFRSMMRSSTRLNSIRNTHSQHEGYFSPNYVPDEEPFNVLAESTRNVGDEIFNYTRETEQATHSTDELIEAYTSESEAAAKAARSNSSLSSSTSRAGSSAKKAKTDLEKLGEKVDDIMEKYENLWDDAKERASKDLFKSVDDQGDEFLDSVKDIMDEYENIYKSAVERTNSEDLFAEVDDTNESFAPETLLNNLEDQVNQVNELNTIISSLGGRIADNNLRAAIANMTVDELPELRALYRMNDSQLSKYEQMYQKKVNANQNKIQNELSGSLSQLTGRYTNIATYVATDTSTDVLVRNLQKQVDKLNEYNETVSSLMVRIKDVNLREAIAHMSIESLEELKLMNSMTDAQLDEYVALYNQKLHSGALSIKNELSTELSSALGFEVNIDTYYESYKKGMTELAKQLAADAATKEAGEAAGNTLGSGLEDGVKEGFTEEEALQTGKDYTTSLAKGMSDPEAISFLETTVDGIINMIIEPLTDKLPDFKQYGIDTVTAFLEGIESSKDAGFDEVIDGVAQRALDRIGSYKMQFYRLGMNMMAGLSDGINARAAQVAGSASKVALKALNAAKKAVDSHSPSKEFMKLGKFMDEGLAIGLKQYSGIAEDASDEMAMNSLSAVQEAISQLSGMLDGSIDVAPVITPTLDLSEVNARSSALASMFNDRQIAVQAQVDEQQAAMITKLGNIIAEQNTEPRSVVFNQTNNSPKALSTGEIYRQTRNGFSRLVSAVT